MEPGSHTQEQSDTPGTWNLRLINTLELHYLFSFFFISVVLIPLSFYSNKIFMRILSPGIKISQQTYEKCTLQICLNYSVLKNYNASIFYTRHPILYWHVTVHFQRNSATTSVIYGICLLNLDPIDLP